MAVQFQKSSLQLYRDCLRLIRHIAPGQSTPKAIALRSMVRTEFKKHKDVQDEAEIERLQSAAVRGLSNYKLLTVATMTTNAAGKGRGGGAKGQQQQQQPQKTALQERIQDYHERSVKEAKKEHAKERDRR